VRERLVSGAVQRLNLTRIVIAHRLEPIASANMVFTMIGER
jgi:ABC-type bacteriocin/lantibiotic exporter with double-glycine peptidase domain